MLQVLEHGLGAAGPQVGEHGRALGTGRGEVAAHALEVGADVRREVDLVDDEQVGLDEPEAALARDVVAGRDVDHVEPVVDEIGGEGGGEVVAAGLDQDDVERAVLALESLGGVDVQDGSSRIAVCGQAPVSTPTTSSGAISPPACSRSASSFVTRSFVITATRKPSVGEQRQQPLDQAGLAGADRAADADPDGLGRLLEDVERTERHALIGSHVQSSPSTSTR